MRALRSPLLLYLAVVGLVFLACDATDPDPIDGGHATIQGTIRNSTGARVQGATVRIGGVQTTTNIDGHYSLLAEQGENEAFTITAPGYNTYTESLRITGGDTIDRTISGPNQVSGQVVNSQDGQPVSGASVSFFRGTGTTVELLATTNSSGYFNITDAPDGTFTLCIYADGFVDFCRPGVQITGGSFAIDPVAVTSTPANGTYRIVLTWGTQPNDLDAHLTGPDGGSGRFHVYYGNRDAGGATLDHDDTSANGPETMSINAPHTGMYRFSVFNYSTQSAAGAAGMAGSPTRVEVYSQEGLIRSYTAPSGGSGNTWRVFEMTLNGSSITFNDNGGASLGYQTAAGSSDAGTFLTGGGDAPAAEKRPSL